MDPIPARAGIGLRTPHHGLVRSDVPAAAWLEVHPENYMADDAALADLEAIRLHYPLSLHAVGLSLGSAEGVDDAHITRLRRLIDRLQPGLVSDHLSWSVSDGRYLPDLLPLPYTQEALRIVCRNVERVQEGIGRALLVENPSTYLRFADSELPEPDFLAAVARRTGCGVLLDVNNIYVSACNQRLDAAEALSGWCAALAPAAVFEMHLAGHAIVSTAAGTPLRIDDHGDYICPAVWALYEQAIAWRGPCPTLVEWDTRLPSFEVLQDEAARAQSCLDRVAQQGSLAPRAPRQVPMPAASHAL